MSDNIIAAYLASYRGREDGAVVKKRHSLGIGPAWGPEHPEFDACFQRWYAANYPSDSLPSPESLPAEKASEQPTPADPLLASFLELYPSKAPTKAAGPDEWPQWCWTPDEPVLSLPMPECRHSAIDGRGRCLNCDEVCVNV
jgi:hypothetical protein